MNPWHAGRIQAAAMLVFRYEASAHTARKMGRYAKGEQRQADQNLAWAIGYLRGCVFAAAEDRRS
jgi:hypothetical protein